MDWLLVHREIALLVAVQEILDSFQKTEFWYVNDKGQKDSCAAAAAAPCRPVSHRDGDKWWLPVPCVTKPGLTESARRDLRQKHDCASQIHKAAMAINNGVLAEIRIPELYKQTLPKVQQHQKSLSLSLSPPFSFSIQELQIFQFEDFSQESEF